MKRYKNKYNVLSSLPLGGAGGGFLLLLIELLIGLKGTSQTISVSAPSHVAVGEQFKLMYSIGTTDVKGFRAGNIPEALEVLMGPSTSTQSSFQMVNGHTSSSSSVTYTYILCANKGGSFVIPSAHATVAGRQVSSTAIRVKVSGQASQNGVQQQGGGQGAQVRAAGSAIRGNDLFIRVSASKQRVHEQEPVLLTYKVYTQVELTQLEGKMPDLNGFHTQEVPLPQQKSFHVETIKGRPYRCVTWSQYVMYPQMTGKLQVPSITFKGVVVQENRNVDPFEAFFNGGSGYVEVKKDIVAPSVTITVDPLPNKPADFSGGVGKFSISASLDRKSVAANDPVNLLVVIGGVGNLKLIKQPVVQWPKDFDKYDAKVTDKTRLTANGVEGNMIYDYLGVPRNKGDFTIPPVEFTYYDTGSSSYKTIRTQALKVTVTPGKGGKNAVETFDANDMDIHPVKQSDDGMTRDNIFFGTMLYKIIIGAIFIAFAVLMWLFRKRAMERADVVGMKGRKANKVATRRLKRAARLMQQQKQEEFYDEVLRALWGYVGDKLNIPVAELSRENITEQLMSHGVGNGIITVFVDAIDECEFARYAPGEARGKMNNVYDKAVKGITDIDEFLKQSGKSGGMGRMKMLMALAVAALCSASGSAMTLDEANTAYSKGDYQKAIAGYMEALKTSPSASGYYNLGNALYRSDDITHAIIAYEKASLLDPSDADIQHNLRLARTKTIDKMQPQEGTFINAGWNSFVNLFCTDTWAWISIVSLLLVVLLALTFLFVDAVWLRQVGFYGAILFFFAFVLATIAASIQMSRLNANDGAVITSSDCVVRKSPEAKGVETATVHEGTHLSITDTTIPNWYEVTLDDGTEGWIPTNSVEIIRIN